jgi:hypothetical protein
VSVKFLYLFFIILQVVVLNRLLSNGSSSKDNLSPNFNNHSSNSIPPDHHSGSSQSKRNEFYMIGLNLLRSFIHETEWPHLSTFPRMSLCEIYIREVGTTHPYLIQCVLRINIFNEIIFICVWHWLLFIGFLTLGDFLVKFFSFFLSCSNCKRKLFALKYLQLIHLNSSGLGNNFNIAKNHLTNQNEDFLYVVIGDKTIKPTDPSKDPKSTSKCKKSSGGSDDLDLFERFCDLNFTNDTLFALELLEKNANTLIVSEVIEHLWHKFKHLNLIHSTRDQDYLISKLLVLKKTKNKQEDT